MTGSIWQKPLLLPVL